MRRSATFGSLPASAQNIEAIIYTIQQIFNLISSLLTIITQIIQQFFGG